MAKSCHGRPGQVGTFVSWVNWRRGEKKAASFTSQGEKRGQAEGLVLDHQATLRNAIREEGTCGLRCLLGEQGKSVTFLLLLTFSCLTSHDAVLQQRQAYVQHLHRFASSKCWCSAWLPTQRQQIHNTYLAIYLSKSGVAMKSTGLETGRW